MPLKNGGGDAAAGYEKGLMPMRTLEETIAAAMDVSDMELLPFLPYILQDFWEIGADPGTIVALIRKHGNNRERLRVLDLGCGKGAVSVRIAAELGHACYGIDAILKIIPRYDQVTAVMPVTGSMPFPSLLRMPSRRRSNAALAISAGLR
jgi:SAM-dependent methyltransferase